MHRLPCLTFAILVLLSPCAVTGALASDGFFTVGQDEGRWWLFDPDGERFFSTGVNVLNSSGYFAPDLGYSPYERNILELYGSHEAWGDVAFERLMSWNFNTVGAWSSFSLFEHRMPYTLNLALSPADWQHGTVPDLFSDDFYDQVASEMASKVVPRAADPNLIGYFLNNELRWGTDWRGITDLFAEYFAFESGSPGKTALVQFLRDRYGDDVAAFNAAWGFSIASFDELHAMTDISPYSFEEVQKADREAFSGMVAEHYFSYCHDAIRSADPNHLILGCRFVSWITPLQVLQASAAYVDVLSVNHYLPWPFYRGIISILAAGFSWTDPSNMLARFYEVTQKPILISEFSIRAMDSGLPNSYPYNWFFETMETQAERADWFEEYARATFRSGYVVGYHWFSYMDEPQEGRFDGENSNFGLVDNDDVPWSELVDRMTVVNADAYNWPIPDNGEWKAASTAHAAVSSSGRTEGPSIPLNSIVLIFLLPAAAVALTRAVSRSPRKITL